MFFPHKTTYMFIFSALRSGLLLYFSLKTKSFVCHHFQTFASFLPHTERTFALVLTQQVNQALQLKRSRQHLSSRDLWNLTPAQQRVLYGACTLEQRRPCTRTNVTTSNFNSHILQKLSQMRPFWSQSRALHTCDTLFFLTYCKGLVESWWWSQL